MTPVQPSLTHIADTAAIAAGAGAGVNSLIIRDPEDPALLYQMGGSRQSVRNVGGSPGTGGRKPGTGTEVQIH
jgi:hypothetical protein